jgi:chromosome segregation ATPase
MSKTNVAQQAVDLVNESRQSQLVQSGTAIVREILGLRASIKNEQETIAKLQKEIEAIRSSVISDVSILGHSLPSEVMGNENERTIAKIISTMNKARQDDIAFRSTRLTQAILSAQGSIETLTKQVDEQVKKLLALELAPVTTDQVLG